MYPSVYVFLSLSVCLSFALSGSVTVYEYVSFTVYFISLFSLSLYIFDIPRYKLFTGHAESPVDLVCK